MKKWLIAVVPIILILGIIIIMIFQNRMDVKAMREYCKNTEEIKDIPRSYYNKAENGGKLEEFYYDTFESKTYNEKGVDVIFRYTDQYKLVEMYLKKQNDVV